MHRRQLPIARPCDQDWDAMRRDGDGRRCERCATTVVDLSALTEREVKQLIARKPGGFCARYRADDDGAVQFRSPPPRRGVRQLAVGVGLGLASLVGAAGPAFADTSIAPTPGTAAEHDRATPDEAHAKKKNPPQAPPATKDKPAEPHARRPTPPPRHVFMGAMSIRDADELVTPKR